MSDATRSALDAAIRDHIADECPDNPLVIAWVANAAMDNDGSDEEDAYFVTTPPGQRGFMTLGLLHSAIG